MISYLYDDSMTIQEHDIEIRCHVPVLLQNISEVRFIPAASAPSPKARFSLQGDSGRSARLKLMWRAGPRRYKSKQALPHSAGTIERRSDPLTSE